MRVVQKRLRACVGSLRAACLVLSGLGLTSAALPVAPVPIPRSAQAETPKRGQTTKHVEVMVTAVAGRDVYLDLGRRAGLEVNDVVQLEPRASPTVSATIFSISRDSSRARLTSVTAKVEVGTSGTVRIPLKRLRKKAPAADEEEPDAASATTEETEDAETAPPKQVRETLPERAVREHPEWEQPPEGWDKEVPLLAPAHARAPEERDIRTRGRVFTNFDVTEDNVSGRNTYLTSLSGVDLEVENLFGNAGRLQLDFSYLARRADLSNGGRDEEATLRPGRFSYRWGGLRGQQRSFEVGRFLHAEFSELGLIDGIEHIERLPSGDRWGTSFGFLPELSDELRTGDDLAASVFYRYVSGDDERVSAGAAFQKTWNQGAADRDLIIGSFSARPDASTSIYATALIDYYTSGDDLKSSAFEITQLNVNANWRSGGGYGLSAFGTQIRFPQLDREEFQGLNPEQIADDFVRRVGLNGWYNASKSTRLNARVDTWEDQDDTGNNASVRMTLKEVLFSEGDVSLEVFSSEGKFSSSHGARLSAYKRLDFARARLSWDVSNNDQSSLIGDDRTLLQHTVRAGLDSTIGINWNLSVFADSRFGDEQDSLSLGVYLQRNL